MDIVTSLVASRLTAQQRALDVTANNIANANTPGYRTQRVQFSDWVDRQPGGRSGTANGDKTIVYTQDRATWREARSGTLLHTGNPFDLALTGDGYFTVNTRNGPRLTRDGRFGLLPDGTLADTAGNAVLNTNGRPILLAPEDTNVSVAADGSVSSSNGPVGKIGVVVPNNPRQLSAEGATQLASSAPTAPAGNPGIVQGAIENSNVEPVLELTRMTDNARQFEMLTQFVQAEADRHQAAIDKILPQGGA